MSISYWGVVMAPWRPKWRILYCRCMVMMVSTFSWGTTRTLQGSPCRLHWWYRRQFFTLMKASSSGRVVARPSTSSTWPQQCFRQSSCFCSHLKFPSSVTWWDRERNGLADGGDDSPFALATSLSSCGIRAADQQRYRQLRKETNHKRPLLTTVHQLYLDCQDPSHIPMYAGDIQVRYGGRTRQENRGSRQGDSTASSRGGSAWSPHSAVLGRRPLGTRWGTCIDLKPICPSCACIQLTDMSACLFIAIFNH